jgi:hypothetical protein
MKRYVTYAYVGIYTDLCVHICFCYSYNIFVTKSVLKYKLAIFLLLLALKKDLTSQAPVAHA